MWTAIGVGTVILAISGFIWYTVKKAALNESNTAQLERDSKEKSERIRVIEEARLEVERALREKERLESEEVVARSDAARAAELLRDAWKSNHGK